MKPAEWLGDALRVLDQRVLPQREDYLTLRDWREVAEAIREMVVRGAPLIGITAAYGLALAHLRGEDLEEAAEGLRTSRPTAVNLFWALERVLRSRDPVAEALEIHREEKERCFRMAEHGVQLLKPNSRVMTICNTGSLATGGIGTALGVIKLGFKKGLVKEVLVLETRPWLQGARLTAWELLKEGVPHRVIADGAAAWAMARLGVDAVFVGADRVAANGDVANKIGTYGLALAAKAHGVPFYVVAPKSSFDPKTPSGSEIPVEERGEEEVLGCGGKRVAPQGSRAWNPVFDVTPASFITAYITEDGVSSGA